MKSSGRETICDVAIIGGGPAGCATAICLARAGSSVIVFESTASHNRNRTETISAQAQRALGEIGIRSHIVAGASQTSFGVVSIWGADQPQFADHLLRHRSNAGLHVDRSVLEKQLLEDARSCGVTVLSESRFASEPLQQRGKWRFNFEHQGARGSCTCRVLVDATGRRGSFWLRALPPRIPLDQLTAVLWTGVSRRCSPYLVVESVPDGWFYLAASGRMHTTIGLITEGDCYQRSSRRLTEFWLRSLAQTVCVKKRLPRHVERPNLSVVSAATIVRTRSAGPGWCAVGDAAFSHDPLSGLGLNHALQSAIHASFSIGRHLGVGTPFDEYEHWVRSRLGDYLLGRQKTYAIEQRWPESLFWQRRQT